MDASGRARAGATKLGAGAMGLVGLGVMGSRMARNLLKAGYPVVVYNRSPGPVQRLAKEGAIPAASPKMLAKRCRVVVLALLDSKAVEDVVLGPEGLINGLSPGSIVIDTSTIDPSTAIRVSESLKERRMHFLDAPVSGGPEGAAAGTLTFMVGGDRSAFKKAEPLMKELGKNVFYLGRSGTGLKFKLVNQSLVGVYFMAVAESYLWAKKMGLKSQDLQKIISLSWGDSPVFRHFLSVVSSGELKGGASIRNLEKDLGLILRSAKEEGARLSLAELSQEYISKAARMGYEDFDTTAVYLILDKIRKVS